MRRKGRGIVAVLQFVCEDNPANASIRLHSFNPDSPKHLHALSSLMHMLDTQLELLFPPDTCPSPSLLCVANLPALLCWLEMNRTNGSINVHRSASTRTQPLNLMHYGAIFAEAFRIVSVQHLTPRYEELKRRGRNNYKDAVKIVKKSK